MKRPKVIPGKKSGTIRQNKKSTCQKEYVVSQEETGLMYQDHIVYGGKKILLRPPLFLQLSGC